MRNKGVILLVLLVFVCFVQSDLNESNVSGFNESEVNITEEVNGSGINANESMIEVNITEEVVNESSFNATEEVVNESLVVNETNIAETNETYNVTEDVNFGDLNLTEEINATVRNVSFTVDERPKIRVVINQPARMVKKVIFDGRVSEVNISIPDNARNLSIKKKLDDVVFDVWLENVKVKELGMETLIEETNLITGNAVMDRVSYSIIKFFRMLFNNFFTITGFAFVEDDNKTLVIDEEVEEVEIEYDIPGPEAMESYIYSYLNIVGKKIVISSDVHFEDVLAYMEIPEGKGVLKLMHEGHDFVGFDSFDKNGDGVIDYIEWSTSLSTQTYSARWYDAGSLNASLDAYNNTVDYVNIIPNTNENWIDETVYGNNSVMCRAGYVGGLGDLYYNWYKDGVAVVDDGLVSSDTKDIILELNFDEGEGNFAYDIGGEGNDGIFNGTWVDGKYGKGLKFDGSEYVEVSVSGYNSTEMWLKNDSISWTHVVNSSGVIYVNGEVSDHFIPISVSGGNIRIGENWNGTIDEMRLWNKSLNSWEILGLYHYGNHHLDPKYFDKDAQLSCAVMHSSEDSLVSFYGFDEGSGNVTYDLTGSNNGTLGNDSSNTLPNWGDSYGVKGYKALEFDGIDDFVQVDTNGELSKTAGTIEAWVNQKSIKNYSIISTLTEVSNESSGLVLLMHFNNDSGAGENNTFIYDWSGYGNNGTCDVDSGDCPVYNLSNKRLGAAGLEFDGSDDFINISNGSNLNITGNQVTVSAWIKPIISGGMDGSAGAIVTRGDGGFTGSYGLYFDDRGGARATNGALFITANGTKNICITDGADNTITDNAWNYVVGVYDGTNCMVYVNGVRGGDLPSATPNLGGNITAVTIGRNSHASVNLDFKGGIDEVAIWNRSLSTAEIQSAYLGGLSLHRNENDLVFSAGNATLTTDVSSWSGDEWHHIAGSYGSGSATLYVDGSSVATGDFAEIPSIENDTYIGNDWIGLYGFNGTIDDVGIWSKTLGAADIEMHYKKGIRTHSLDKLRVDTGLSDFNRSLYENLNITGQDGNVTLANETASSYYEYGNLTSQLFYLKKSDDLSLMFNTPLMYGKEGEQEDELVLLMHFDNETSDWSGYGNNGVNSGANCSSLDNGKFYGGCDFDGSDDYIDCGNDISLNSSEMSVSVWINPSLISHQLVSYFIAKYFSNDSAGWGVGILGSFGSCGGVDGRVFLYEPVQETIICSDTALTTNEWHHVVATHNGTDTIIYINGQEDLSTGTSQNITFDSNIILNIGRRKEPSALLFNGTMDEVKIWNKTLSADDVRNEYLRGILKVKLKTKTGNFYIDENPRSKLYLHFQKDFNDESDEGNNGVNYESVSFKEGKLGAGAYFDGTGHLNVTGEYPTSVEYRSLCTWAKHASGSFTGDSDMAISYGADLVGNGFGFMIYTGDTWWFYGGGGSYDFDTGVSADNGWHYHCMTYNGDYVKYYLDGVNVKSARRVLTNPEGNFTIGSGPGNLGDDKFNGTIDEVLFYDYVLSANEIRNLYENYNDWSDWSGPDPAKSYCGLGCIFGFDFSEMEGGVTYDESSNGNNGTISNADWSYRGKHGKALEFDGDDYVEVSVSGYNSTEMWLKNDSISWTHVVNSSGVIYVNGEVSDHFIPISVSGGNLRIGVGWNGTIDSLVVYNRSLAWKEVREHYDDYYTNFSRNQLIGDVNNFLMYRAEFETDNVNETPVLNSVTIKQINYSVFVRNYPPGAVNLGVPENGTIILITNTTTFYFYESEDVDAGYFNFSLSGLLNYFSFDYDKKNSTSVFDSKDDKNQGFIQEGVDCSVSGSAGEGCKFNGSGFIEIDVE